MAIFSLDQVITIIIGWEKDLEEFYSMINSKLKDEDAKSLISLLDKDQVKIVQMLDDIDLVHHHEEFEFNKNLPDYKHKNIIPNFQISELSSPKAILGQIFDFEEEILSIYKHLREIVAYEKSREMLDMLIQMKLGQVKKIKSCMDSYDLTT